MGLNESVLEEASSELFIREGDELADFRKDLNRGYLNKSTLDSYEGKQLPCPPYDW